jgi:DNA polymerase-3 subunit gamma/tau
VDPSTKALLARIERLEGGHRGAATGLRAVAAPEDAPTSTGSIAPPAQGDPANGAPPAPAAPTTNGASAATEPPHAPEARPPAAATAGTSSPPVAARAAPALEPEPEALAEVAELPALDIPAAVELWAAVVELVRDQNKMLAALLKDARPVRVSDRELDLVFPPGAAFLKRKAEQEDHRRAASDALHAVSGRALALRYELGSEELAGEADDAVLTGEELVQRFLQEFDAHELVDGDPDHENEAT